MRNTIFVKYSNERDNGFKIKTVISKDKAGKRYVEKCALTEAAKKHIEQIAEYGKQLNDYAKDTRFCFNKCTVTDGVLECEYINGEPLSAILNQKVLSNDHAGALELILDYCSELDKMATETFSVTEEFQTVFGNVEFDCEQKSCPVTDVDMIFSNIIVSGNDWNVLDYEWTYSFPIPVKFVVFRAIIATRESTRRFLEENLQLFGISKDEFQKFIEMEINFQRSVKGEEIKLEDFSDLQKRTQLVHSAINNFFDGAEDVAVSILQNGQAKIFFRKEEEEFSENNSDAISFSALQEGCRIPLEPGTRYIRLDPVEEAYCILQDLEVCCDGREIGIEATNGIQFADKLFFFNDDPQLIFKLPESNAKEVMLRMKILPVTTKLLGNEFTEAVKVNNVIAEKVDHFRAELCENTHQLRTEVQENTHQLRTEVQENTHQLRTEVQENTQQLRGEVRENTQQLRTEMQENIHQTNNYVSAQMSQVQAELMGIVCSGNVMRAQMIRMQNSIADEAQKNVDVEAQLNQLKARFELEFMRLERERAEAQQRAEMLQNSRAYRLGRMITWLPRKIKDFWRKMHQRN